MIAPATFRKKLLHWSEANPRYYPWIGEKDPYKIWISEIMLQQTRSDQTVAHFNHFISSFPNLNCLSAATEDEVLFHWKGLGYYSRARNLLRTAKILTQHQNGVFPQDPQQLTRLPGIGDYTAAAIASFAYQIPAPVIDGNVIRVYSRVFGIAYLPENVDQKKNWFEIAKKYLDVKSPGVFNQALMNFGALHCKPRQPLCNECPFAEFCHSYLNAHWSEFPVKKQKAPIKNRYFHYVLLVNDNQEIAIQQRRENDIWKSLYELPFIETDQPKNMRKLDLNKLITHNSKESHLIKLTKLTEMVSTLSHQKIHCTFYTTETVSLSIKIKDSISFVNRENLANFAFPSALMRFLSRYNTIQHAKQSHSNRQSG